ncbi:MAG: hypothetical protein HQK54_10420, partial [Oligoflexales bacterium]|nr:hypothetical protein [Oligoflexales bacterium]
LKAQLPQDLQARVDMNIYLATQLLRLPRSFYPGGGQMVDIPHSSLEREDWFNHLNELEAMDIDEIEPFFLPVPPENATKRSRMVFEERTKEPNRHKVYRSEVKHQAEKNKIISAYLSKHPGKIAPCIQRLAEAASRSESLGFHGRCKLIYESRRAGLLEDEICRFFLLADDPERYGDVIEMDPNPDIDGCGYRLRDKFKVSNFADPGCESSDLASFCIAERCYRSELNLAVQSEPFGVSDPSFEEFQMEARQTLEGFLND